jgi:hypothetical protein
MDPQSTAKKRKNINAPLPDTPYSSSLAFDTRTMHRQDSPTMSHSLNAPMVSSQHNPNRRHNLDASLPNTVPSTISAFNVPAKDQRNNPNTRHDVNTPFRDTVPSALFAFDTSTTDLQGSPMKSPNPNTPLQNTPLSTFLGSNAHFPHSASGKFSTSLRGKSPPAYLGPLVASPDLSSPVSYRNTMPLQDMFNPASYKSNTQLSSTPVPASCALDAPFDDTLFSAHDVVGAPLRNTSPTVFFETDMAQPNSSSPILREADLSFQDTPTSTCPTSEILHPEESLFRTSNDLNKLFDWDAYLEVTSTPSVVANAARPNTPPSTSFKPLPITPPNTRLIVDEDLENTADSTSFNFDGTLTNEALCPTGAVNNVLPRASSPPPHLFISKYASYGTPPPPDFCKSIAKLRPNSPSLTNLPNERITISPTSNESPAMLSEEDADAILKSLQLYEARHEKWDAEDPYCWFPDRELDTGNETIEPKVPDAPIDPFTTLHNPEHDPMFFTDPVMKRDVNKLWGTPQGSDTILDHGESAQHPFNHDASYNRPAGSEFVPQYNPAADDVQAYRESELRAALEKESFDKRMTLQGGSVEAAEALRAVEAPRGRKHFMGTLH